jgi:selenocysteine lyase/cysteine desulfurase
MAWTALASSLTAAATDDARLEDYWRLVKRQFPLADGLIYFNAANVCPASRPVMDRHLEYLRDFHADPSFQNRDKYVPIQERLREKLATLVGVTADEIAVVRNTSEGNNIVAGGMKLKPGDEVLITDHNHPSNREAWQVRARRDGFNVRSLPCPAPAPGAAALIHAFEKAITPRTRVIAVTHVTSTAGVLYPVREIAALASRRGIWFHVDGAQSCGALDVNLRAIGCDSYAASAHKWPMGPLEAGVLYVRADRVAELWPSIVTAGWSESLKGARKFEVFGQRDNPRICGFEAAVDFLNLIGMARVESRLREIAARLKRGLEEIDGVELITNREPELSGGVVWFRVRNRPPKQVYDVLWTRHRIACAHAARGETAGVRFSPHVYNSPEEIDRSAAAVRELARS